MAYSSSEILETGYIYAPYIPLQVTPTLNMSDLMCGVSDTPSVECKYRIISYDEIYTDIKIRFEILDL